MGTSDFIKQVALNVTRIGVPSLEDARNLLTGCTPRLLRFRDDGYIPNNPKHAVLLYSKAIRIPRNFDPAATFEALFKENGWRDIWHNGIYDFVHYHSSVHEALGVARGKATLQVGGNKGRELTLRSGDLLVLPAGTGHECLKASKNFLVVGGYPPKGVYDECRGSAGERVRAIKSIARVAVPSSDPLYGKEGPLVRAWRS